MPLFVRWQMKLSLAKLEIKSQTLLKSLGPSHSNCSISSVLCWIGIRGVKGYTELFTGMLKLAQTCSLCQIRHGPGSVSCCPCVTALCSEELGLSASKAPGPRGHVSPPHCWNGVVLTQPGAPTAYAHPCLVAISPLHDPEVPRSKPWGTGFPQKKRSGQSCESSPPRRGKLFVGVCHSPCGKVRH